MFIQVSKSVFRCLMQRYMNIPIISKEDEWIFCCGSKLNLFCKLFILINNTDMSHASISDSSSFETLLSTITICIRNWIKSQIEEHHLRIDYAEEEYVQPKISTS